LYNLAMLWSKTEEMFLHNPVMTTLRLEAVFRPDFKLRIYSSVFSAENRDSGKRDLM